MNTIIIRTLTSPTWTLLWNKILARAAIYILLFPLYLSTSKVATSIIGASWMIMYLPVFMLCYKALWGLGIWIDSEKK